MSIRRGGAPSSRITVRRPPENAEEKPLCGKHANEPKSANTVVALVQSLDQSAPEIGKENRHT